MVSPGFTFAQLIELIDHESFQSAPLLAPAELGRTYQLLAVLERTEKSKLPTATKRRKNIFEDDAAAGFTRNLLKREEVLQQISWSFIAYYFRYLMWQISYCHLSHISTVAKLGTALPMPTKGIPPRRGSKSRAASDTTNLWTVTCKPPFPIYSKTF
jgi:hypothetical protein